MTKTVIVFHYRVIEEPEKLLILRLEKKKWYQCKCHQSVLLL